MGWGGSLGTPRDIIGWGAGAGYIMVGRAWRDEVGCVTGWHAGAPWLIFFSIASNLVAMPVTKFRNSKKLLDLE